MSELQASAWLVHGGRTFVNKAFISEDQAKRSIEERKDGAQIEPMVKLSDAIAYAEEAVRREREACAKLVQDYYTHGDNTQGWQDVFAERIRSRSEQGKEQG